MTQDKALVDMRAHDACLCETIENAIADHGLTKEGLAVMNEALAEYEKKVRDILSMYRAE